MNISLEKSISSISSIFKKPSSPVSFGKRKVSFTAPTVSFNTKRSNSVPQPPTKDSNRLSSDSDFDAKVSDEKPHLLIADKNSSPLSSDSDFDAEVSDEKPHSLIADVTNSPKELGEKKSAEWFEKNSNSFTLLDQNTGRSAAKDLAKLEKKFPEALQDSIVDNMLREGFKEGDSIETNNQHQFIRKNLSPVYRTTVDKKIIDILKASGNDTAVEQYQDKHLSLDSMKYDDVIRLDKKSNDLKDSYSLEKAEQEKQVTSTKDTLNDLNTDSWSEDQKKILQKAKQGVAHLERSLPLVDKAQVSKPDLLKTLLASGGLAASLAALGALISLLVKLGGPSSDNEAGEADDQTEAIEANQHDIEDKQQNIKDLKAQEQELLDKGAHLSEEEVVEKTKNEETIKVIADGHLVNDITHDGSVVDVQPDNVGNGLIQEVVDKSVAEHREKQSALNNIKSEITSAENNLGTLQDEITDLQYQQGKYKAQEAAHSDSEKTQNLNTNSETGMLASLGIGALLATTGGCGLFAVKHSKILPKLKLQRARQQASQSLNQLVNINQSQFVEMPRVTNDSPNSQTTIRQNSI